MLYLVLALALGLALHLGAIATTGALLGIELRGFTYGIGPKIKLGRLSLGMLPIAGSVHFRLDDDPNMEAGHDEFFPPRGRALDTAPVWMQLAVALSGCAALLLAAFALAPGQALHDFLATPGQILYGLGRTHGMLAAGLDFARTQPFTATFTLVAAKLAAINLLPFLGSNGSQAIMVIARALGWNRPAPQGLLVPWFFAGLVVGCLWLYGAIGYALNGQMG